MACPHVGRLPIKKRLNADLTSKTHAKCPTCGRVVKLGPFGRLTSHNTEREIYAATIGKIRLAEARKVLKVHGIRRVKLSLPDIKPMRRP